LETRGESRRTHITLTRVRAHAGVCSTNKTYLNGAAIEPRRYYELKEQDTLKFGFSSREYVLLHENSAGDEGAASSNAAD